MAIETLYADALTSGTVSTSANALGTTNGVYTTDTGNVSWTARFSLADPVNAATAEATHTVTVRVRKETGHSGTPSAQVNLYSDSTLIKSIIATTSVTNATSQRLVHTFTTELSDLTAVQVELVATAAGCNPSTRSSVQLDSIDLDANTTPAAPAVNTAYRVSFPTPARALVDGAGL
jgi:hypothetical protein